MRRSLRVRWTVALVAVCLAQAALVAYAVRMQTERAFERFIAEEMLVGFTRDVAAHVREAGTVDGFRPPRSMERRRARPRGPQPAIKPIRFGLADPDGIVVKPFDGFEVGDRLPPDRLGGGLPVVVGGAQVGTAFVPEAGVEVPDTFPPWSPEGRFLAASERGLLWGLAGGLVLALAVGIGLISRTTRPLRALTEAAKRVAEGALGASVDVRTDDEVGRLGATFNAMSARLAEADRLREQMTADLAHDLRTPLTGVVGTLEAMRDGTLPVTPERIETVHTEAVRLSRLVDDLDTLARADAHALIVEPRPVRPAAVLRHVAQAFEAEAQQAGVALDVRAEADLPEAHADPDRLIRVLSNLVGNAVRHTPRGGQVTLGASAEGDGVALTVADTGEGVPADLLPRVFERSVRGDAARSTPGSGLGLSIVRSLVEAMGGGVEADSQAGEGTTIRLWLPAWSPAGDDIG